MTEYMVRIRKEIRDISKKDGYVISWELYEIDSQNHPNPEMLLTSYIVTSPRSRFYKLLTSLLLHWNPQYVGYLYITEELAQYLQIIFENRSATQFWLKTLRILEEEGRIEAWNWLKEKLPVLKLKNKLEGGQKCNT